MTGGTSAVRAAVSTSPVRLFNWRPSIRSQVVQDIELGGVATTSGIWSSLQTEDSLSVSRSQHRIANTRDFRHASSARSTSPLLPPSSVTGQAHMRGLDNALERRSGFRLTELQPELHAQRKATRKAKTAGHSRHIPKDHREPSVKVKGSKLSSAVITNRLEVLSKGENRQTVIDRSSSRNLKHRTQF